MKCGKEEKEPRGNHPKNNVTINSIVIMTNGAILLIKNVSGVNVPPGIAQ